MDRRSPSRAGVARPGWGRAERLDRVLEVEVVVELLELVEVLEVLELVELLEVLEVVELLEVRCVCAAPEAAGPNEACRASIPTIRTAITAVEAAIPFRFRLEIINSQGKNLVKVTYPYFEICSYFVTNVVLAGRLGTNLQKCTTTDRAAGKNAFAIPWCGG